MKIASGILFVMVLFLSCRHHPKVLSAKQMKEVMWDMVRADVYVTNYVMKDSTRNKKTESLKLYQDIFRIHNTTEQQFKTSFDYYTSQPLLFRPILDSLARREQMFTPAPYGRHLPSKKDSLRKAFFSKPLPVK